MSVNGYSIFRRLNGRRSDWLEKSSTQKQQWEWVAGKLNEQTQNSALIRDIKFYHVLNDTSYRLCVLNPNSDFFAYFVDFIQDCLNIYANISPINRFVINLYDIEDALVDLLLK